MLLSIFQCDMIDVLQQADGSPANMQCALCPIQDHPGDEDPGSDVCSSVLISTAIKPRPRPLSGSCPVAFGYNTILQ